ncbi:hypothetical protein FLONG3_8812 [Fusarium longipes]|uniref:Uncharacterized protein n=1 Tax=Fusarium longipes TaxID=694270 RepID=A0A395S2H9_9HYPO|nr:hypothetical protein FLONG3_8812 [Fusarium longipes]
MAIYNRLGSYDEQQKAIRGECVPRTLDCSVALAALIQGTRLHYDFANTEAVICHSRLNDEVARARNARLIVSNEIPDSMDEESEQQPYCIWYPDLATEETCRTLFSKYPNMRYQIGRACAAAGYYTLYKELSLLPDVSIAEEARESRTEGGRQIYNDIMNAEFPYAVIDDSQRQIAIDFDTVLAEHPAYLNGDTEVRWRPN